MTYTFEDIDDITQSLIASDRKLIFIAWPSASGKSLFAKRLVKKLEESWHSILAISSDDYYKNNTQLHALMYGTYDHPHLIEYDRLSDDLETYFETGHVSLPKYSFIEKRTIAYEEVSGSHDFVIVEWIYTISSLKTSLPHHSIYVTSPHEEILVRRFLRDQERTKEPAHTLITNMDHMFPMWNVYGELQKSADIVIENTFNILEHKGKTFLLEEKGNPSSDRIIEDQVHAIDHVYFDKNEWPYSDRLIVRENYLAEQKEVLRSVDVLNYMDIDKNGKKYRKLLHFRFYQPGIITTVHSLFQLAWLHVHSSENVYITQYSDTEHNEIHTMIDYPDAETHLLLTAVSI